MSPSSPSAMWVLTKECGDGWGEASRRRPDGITEVRPVCTCDDAENVVAALNRGEQ